VFLVLTLEWYARYLAAPSEVCDPETEVVGLVLIVRATVMSHRLDVVLFLSFSSIRIYFHCIILASRCTTEYHTMQQEQFFFPHLQIIVSKCYLLTP